ncbi:MULTISPECIES: glucose 1-dehydrogenase [Rhodococcus]|uniref:glucose 1-dehydrogenase n=1 Tax=Rhodococcus globerulus TaxID=33008 RepID=UPI001C59A6AA|nr:glucose 1-dehydrogenase [Rhodococcus globerulus]QXV99947.1 glucose 1-dehydrogenase [Rhodococcus globerulus]
MSDRLHGKVAVITGAASGIGEGTARRFVAEGACVVIADLQVSAGEALAAELGEAALFVRTDVTEESNIAAAVDAAVEQFGCLDVMFNNAGIMGAMGPIAKLRSDDVDITIAVNLRATLLGMKHAARVMIPRKQGVILSTSSPAGVMGGVGPHAYSATKAGIIGLTQSVAAELRPHGIRVNAVIPGAVVSAMTADLTAGGADDIDGARASLGRTALMGRPGTPEDIAAAALYLVSDDASFVTGIALPVDAGMTRAGGTAPFSTGRHEEPSSFLHAGLRG